MGVDLVGLGLAAVDRLHVQSVSQNEGEFLLLAQVGEPVPGEHALTGDGQPIAEGSDGTEEGIRPGGDSLVQDDGTGRVEDAQGQGPGVQIDAAVESVLLVVESHHGLRVEGILVAGYFKYARCEEAMMSIHAPQQTGHAIDGSSAFNGPSHVSRLLSFVDYEAVGESSTLRCLFSS